jgi:hypothetical protein
MECTEHIDPHDGYYVHIARAIEAAHGITGEQKWRTAAQTMTTPSWR